jgi:hypothetical protein
MRRSPINRSRPQAPRRALLALEALEGRALPSTFTVLNLNDSGPGSLRAAVTSANTTPGADVLQFAPGLKGTITLASELGITDDLAINGPGANHLTVSGNNAFRVFDVSNHATVSIAGLTIANGSVTADESTTFGGGGILNEAGSTLTLTRDTLSNNQATASNDTIDVFGGGLLNEGTAKVAFCTFRGNQALGGGGTSFFGGSAGGGIDNFGGATLTVTNSTFTGNQAMGSGTINWGMGGAIENNAGLDLTHPSRADIRNSAFVNNLAGGVNGASVGQGGAIDNEGTGSILNLVGSLVRGNKAGGGTGTGSLGLGGGLLAQSGATTHIVNSTISGNLAVAGPGGYANGGGILQFANAGPATMTIIHSAVVGNRAVGGPGATGVMTGPTALVGEGLGGGIMNQTSTLTIVDSTVANNQAVGGANATATTQDSEPGAALGGGIENMVSATLLLVNSSVRGNLALGGSTKVGIGGLALGAGIHNQSSSLTIIDSRVVANRAVGGSGGSGSASGLAGGGGLETSAYPGVPGIPPGGPASVSVIDSVFSGNQAIGGSGGNAVGGGINVGFLLGGLTDNSVLTLTDSTLDHNLAQGGAGSHGGNAGDGLGGGLAVQSGASATLSASTVTHNQALGGAAGAGGSAGHGSGGGVYNLGTFTDLASVVKKNKASTSDDDVFGVLTPI